MIGIGNNILMKNNISIAWDLTNVTYIQTYVTSSQDAFPIQAVFSPDGTKMYILGNSNKKFFQYSLSTAWDISTSTYVAAGGSMSAKEFGETGIFIKPDGTKIYMIGITNDSIHEYNLTTAWDITTQTFVQTKSLSGISLNPKNSFFSSDGLNFYFLCADGLEQCSLSSAWNVSTITSVRTLTVATLNSQDTSMQGLWFKDDGTKMFLMGRINDRVYEYDLSTAWDISTATYSKYFSTSPQETVGTGMSFNFDGTKIYVSGQTSDGVIQYNIT